MDPELWSGAGRLQPHSIICSAEKKKKRKAKRRLKGSTKWCFATCFFLVQGHQKDKNNPSWQICFLKVSLAFFIISEKYCPIVLTSIRALWSWPDVFLVIQCFTFFFFFSFCFAETVLVWNVPRGITHMLRPFCYISYLVWNHMQTLANGR